MDHTTKNPSQKFLAVGAFIFSIYLILIMYGVLIEMVSGKGFIFSFLGLVVSWAIYADMITKKFNKKNLERGV